MRRPNQQYLVRYTAFKHFAGLIDRGVAVFKLDKAGASGASARSSFVPDPTTFFPHLFNSTLLVFVHGLPRKSRAVAVPRKHSHLVLDESGIS